MKNPKKAVTKSKNPIGRPSDFTPKKGDLICQRIATHDCGLDKLCNLFDDMPNPSTIYQWRLKHEEFNKKYAHAKMKQADLLAEQCLSIADNSTNETFTVDRLRIDTRKWLASKLLPKQYGDKLLLEQKNEEEDLLKQALRGLREKLDKDNEKTF